MPLLHSPLLYRLSSQWHGPHQQLRVCGEKDEKINFKSGFQRKCKMIKKNSDIFITHVRIRRSECQKRDVGGTRFFGPGKKRIKGKPRYRRSSLVLKPQNGEYESSKSTFLWISNFFFLDFFIHGVPIIDIFFLKTRMSFNIQCLTKNDRKQKQKTGS